jgi:hypothetical protein
MAALNLIPAAISAPAPDYLFGLISLKEIFGIEIKLQPATSGLEFESEFRQNVEGAR